MCGDFLTMVLTVHGFLTVGFSVPRFNHGFKSVLRFFNSEFKFPRLFNRAFKCATIILPWVSVCYDYLTIGSQRAAIL